MAPSIALKELEMKLRVVSVLLVGFLLMACGSATPAPLPTVVLDNGNPTAQAGNTSFVGVGVVASGVVAPAQEAQIAFTTSGKVASVNVAVGDTVTAGQPLVQLEGQEDLQAAVSAAKFELAQAQQDLDDLTSQAETGRIQAMQDIITYEKAVRDAQYALDNFTVPSNQANLDTVEALQVMKQRLDAARLAFEPYKFKSSTDSTRKDLKKALDEAQADYNAAVRRLQYEYDLEVAQSQLAQAQHDYEVLKTGPDPDKLRVAQARLENAQTQLSATQAALDHLTLSAPFAGTISQVNVQGGEWVIAGQSILSLADLEHLQIETTDLSERDVPQVSVGQTVNVSVKALAQQISGRVSQIAPLANSLGGDVVYKTTILLDEQVPGLRAGMSVDVQFITK
jgi:multidrug efflux pump subunit AcrA (membrane-fusion protein)